MKVKMTFDEWKEMMAYVRKRCSKKMSVQVLKCAWQGIELTDEGSGGND